MGERRGTRQNAARQVVHSLSFPPSPGTTSQKTLSFHSHLSSYSTVVGTFSKPALEYNKQVRAHRTLPSHPDAPLLHPSLTTSDRHGPNLLGLCPPYVHILRGQRRVRSQPRQQARRAPGGRHALDKDGAVLGNHLGLIHVHCEKEEGTGGERTTAVSAADTIDGRHAFDPIRHACSQSTPLRPPGRTFFCLRVRKLQIKVEALIQTFLCYNGRLHGAWGGQTVVVSTCRRITLGGKAETTGICPPER